LFAHYGINPNEKEAWFKVNTSFSNNISFSRSRYRTVRIQVLDYSPKKAAQVANSIVIVADSLMKRSKRIVAKDALEIATKQYNEALSEYYSLSDSMSFVMSQGVLDMPNQAKELTKVYAEALAAGNSKAASSLKSHMNQLALYGGDFTRFLFEIENKSKQIVFMQESLHFLKLESEGAISSQFVIDWAFESDKKAKPKKAVIVIVSTLAAMFFSIFLIVFVDFIKTALHPKSVVKE
jgi:capsular polysaccharide biosynthesis protein